ncbi:MAG: hypothetical protein AMJ46_11590 [Latescibacteria bacterium DG_63]|nr:MAG: hypothetical protein AMJ46_11590 [Latescibacteria bacterium DG_63]
MSVDSSSFMSTLAFTTGELVWVFGFTIACLLFVLYPLLRYLLGRKKGHQRTYTHVMGVLAILGLVFLQGLLLGREDSPTYDEPNHVTSGYSYLKTGDFRMSLAQPPVGRMFLALPLLAMRLDLPVGNESWRTADDWTFAREFLFHSGNDADRIMFWARFQVLLLWALLGLVVFAWSRRLFGLRAGYFSLLLYVFSPNILAHGRLATMEIPFACLAFISAYFFWRLLEKPSARFVITSGVFVGLALSAKYSGLVLVFSFLISAVVWDRYRKAVWTDAAKVGDTRPQGSLALSDDPDLPADDAAVSAKDAGNAGSAGVPYGTGYNGLSLRGTVGFTIAVLVIGGVIALLSSGPGMRPVLDYPAVQAKLDKFGEEGVFVFESDRADELAQRLASSLPLPRYVVGILFNHFHFKRGHPAYLAGEWKSGGWWYYFPIAFVLKVPLSLIILLAFAFFVRLRSRLPLSSAEIVLVCVPVVSLLWSMGFVRLNIGFRHILFVLPFVHVLLGQVVSSYQGEKRSGPFRGSDYTKLSGLGKLVPVLLLVWYCLASVSVSPHHLAYFNELAGGPRGGVNWLVDSNLDWGQDLKRLRRYVEENGITSLRLLYFGTGEPAYYGIQFEPLTLKDFENLRMPDAPEVPEAGELSEPGVPYEGGQVTDSGQVSDAEQPYGGGRVSHVEAQYANEKWAMSVTSYAVLLKHAPWLKQIQGHEDARIGHSIFIFSPLKLRSVLRGSVEPQN